MNAGQSVAITVGTNQPALRQVELAELQRAESAKRVLEWEAAGYIRYSKTADLCRSVLTHIEGRSS